MRAEITAEITANGDMRAEITAEITANGDMRAAAPRRPGRTSSPGSSVRTAAGRRRCSARRTPGSGPRRSASRGRSRTRWATGWSGRRPPLPPGPPRRPPPPPPPPSAPREAGPVRSIRKNIGLPVVEVRGFTVLHTVTSRSEPQRLRLEPFNGLDRTACTACAAARVGRTEPRRSPPWIRLRGRADGRAEGRAEQGQPPGPCMPGPSVPDAPGRVRGPRGWRPPKLSRLLGGG